MVTREDRARLELAGYRSHFDHARGNLEALRELGDVAPLISWQLSHAVNEDAARLTAALAAVLDLTDSDVPLNRNNVYNAVLTAMRGQ